MVPRLLLVDDHKLVRAGLARLLEDVCDICGQAAQGQEAIEKVVGLKPDLVLLDISMPIMGGAAAAALEIRRVAPSTKILFLSMNDAETASRLADESGVDGFLSKQSDVQELYKTIARILQLPYEDPVEPRRTNVIPIEGHS